MRRALLLLLALVVVATPAAAAKTTFPDVISLPNGWMPEGIAIHGSTFYAGSRANGAVLAGDLRTGKGSVLVPGVSGRVATGLKYSHGLLFVSGASTGKAWVFDARTGRQLREYPFGGGFINDVVVTRTAAFFTDSNNAVLYRVALSRSGRPAQTFSTLPLTGDFQLAAGFNLNGIDVTSNGKTLISVQSNTGKLFTIQPGTGVTHEIALGGAAVTNGDGILLAGKTLYVVRNTNNEVVVVRLAGNNGSGAVVKTITDADFDVPTTIARLGDRLYLPNARFTTPATPSTPYAVVQVRR